MTGYGSSKTELDGYTLQVEIKCLNSKFLELILRMPREYSTFEGILRKKIEEKLERGKVTVSIDRVQQTPDLEPNSSESEVKPSVFINEALLRAYYRQLLDMAREMHAETSELFKLALRMPDVMSNSEPEKQRDVEADLPLLEKALEQALSETEAFRLREGEITAKKMLECISSIEANLEKILAADPGRRDYIRQRLRDRLQDLAGDIVVNEGRFEQELLFYIEKLDIAEEKLRLQTHLDYFKETVANGNGKKLGFISQEIGREINTIGSKANDATIQKWVVEMKEDLEKIKEQTANIL